MSRFSSIERGGTTLRAFYCYPWVTMSAINGDKARFNRQRKSKHAQRERNRELRKKLAAALPRRPGGRDL